MNDYITALKCVLQAKEPFIDLIFAPYFFVLLACSLFVAWIIKAVKKEYRTITAGILIPIVFVVFFWFLQPTEGVTPSPSDFTLTKLGVYLFPLVAFWLFAKNDKRLRFSKHSFWLKIFLTVLVFMAVVVLVMGIDYLNFRSGTRDSRRVMDVRRLELALEEYYKKYNEYPPYLSVLLERGFLELNYEGEPLGEMKDPFGSYYNYAYGTDKKTGKVHYYHLGAVLEYKKSDLLKQDADYNSSLDGKQVNWQPNGNTLHLGSCLGENGFNGSDDNCCGLCLGAVYDRGVFPEQ